MFNASSNVPPCPPGCSFEQFLLSLSEHSQKDCSAHAWECDVDVVVINPITSACDDSLMLASGPDLLSSLHDLSDSDSEDESESGSDQSHEEEGHYRNPLPCLPETSTIQYDADSQWESQSTASLLPRLRHDTWKYLDDSRVRFDTATRPAMDMTTGAVFAVKKTHAAYLDATTEALTEIQVLMSIHADGISQGVIPLLDFGVPVDDNTSIIMVTPYMSGGSLDSLLRHHGRLDEDSIRRIAQQILRVLAKLHGRVHPILHNDLNPRNIMFSGDGRLSLTGFGLARCLSHSGQQLHTVHGAERYFSPEKLNGTGVNEKSDIWSFGATLWECCSGLGQSGKGKHNRGDLVGALNYFSEECGDFILSCFQPNPSHRPSAMDLLKHPFLDETI